MTLTRAIRRCLILLLASVLLMQFSWSAAASLCEHEAGSGPTHFGHHVHMQKASKVGEHKGQQKSSSDCPVCHLTCAAATCGVLQVSAEPQSASHHRDSLHAKQRLLPHRPDRPRWPIHA